MCLATCLKFSEFEAGCAYELYAYKKKIPVLMRFFIVNMIAIDHCHSQCHRESFFIDNFRFSSQLTNFLLSSE